MTVTDRASRTKEWSLTVVARGLDFPTSLAFAPDGRLFVAESGLPFAGARPGGRVWEMVTGSEHRLLAEGFAPPLNGLTWHDDGLLVASLGQIDRVEVDGTRTTILAGLPMGGNYHTNMVAAGADGWLYFSQGALTNSGVVGLDAMQLAWQRRITPTFDIPGLPVVLTDAAFDTADPLSQTPNARAHTGAFVPFGQRSAAGTRIAAGLPCTAAVMRVRPDGTGLEMVAWGLRNAFGLGFLPDGRLLAVDQGADDRGSRPLGNVPDLLFEVQQGGWYGWPDFIGGDPVTHARYRPQRGVDPTFLLANHDELPPPAVPLFRFRAHVAAAKFAVVPGGDAARHTRIAVALFGDERPMTAPQGPKIGRSVVLLDLDEGQLQPLPIDGLARPIDVAYHPQDGSLYIVDFGQFEMRGGGGFQAAAGSGRVLRAVPNREDDR